MGSLLFEIKDNKDELHRVVVSDMSIRKFMHKI